jgi:hypothetical protein
MEIMTGQRRWLKIWARTVGMPIGINLNSILN